MALKRTRRIPNVEGVSAGNTATVRLPLGLTFHQLWLVFADLSATGVLLAEITGIRVLLNGRVIQRFRSGTELDRINQFNGRAAAGASANGGALCIDFDRYGLKTKVQEEFTKLGTGLPPGDGDGQDPTPLSQATVEIDFAAGTSPSMTAYAVQSAAAPLGIIKKVLTFNQAAAGATDDFILDEFPKGDVYDQVFMYAAGQAITNLRIERDLFDVFERTSLLNNAIQTDGVRVPQTDLYVYDTTEKGNGDEGLVTRGANDVEFRVAVPGAVTVQSNLVTLGGLNT